MSENDWLAQQFESHRAHLRSVAYRMLGSTGEADDAVQEAWLRLSRSDTSAVENLRGWLTTTVSRVSLDMLRARAARRETAWDPAGPMPEAAGPTLVAVADPEQEAVSADLVGAALLVVLDTLTPAERLAFVLHDLFAVPFEEIASILGRTPAAARQLASRARRRVRGADPDAGRAGAPSPRASREVVEAFLQASRGGDVAALLALLDPDAVLRADAATVRSGAEAEVLGAEAVARTFAGRARAARLALIDGAPGLVWTVGGQTRVVFAFTLVGRTVSAIELLSDPDTVAALDIEPC